ncbi:MAG: hypothetical protein ABS62_12330 [Microbacterium sp. SCN 70-200]|uniref:hypothetical protein n=1 Tax=unclassified Microbacterium TaxID=2609290 RepID=UPI00086889B1|nr:MULTISPECIES: hypothetical protein [unclassified Microbacterium]MBN9214087.1 hypothetical protein [Microbacterium sp.]ODT39718.1 MAG: hypothetical protein ABS62_12330 [Microbacterium sp. SCN 70-200]OJV82795.1 MAG: hypothetical protein BGO46_00670 [Microbacterium sp. 70-16]
MVATVLRLRYRVLGNTLMRRPWQLVGFCFGILWALMLLGTVVMGMGSAAAFGDLPIVRMVAVLGGSALLLGWIVGPLLIAGIDTTVDAAKLAPFPLSTRQVMTILTATGFTGIPGIAASIAALASVILWVRWPLAAVFAVPCAALGVLTCVLASRLASALTTGLGGNRRGTELIGTVVLILIIFLGPIITGVLALATDAGGIAAQLAQAGAILAWTPFGAAWDVPAQLAAGEIGIAALKLLIALATVAVLWLGWRRALDRAVVTPPRQTARSVRSGALGLFGVMPTGGVGATWARALTGWLRDPRYLRQIIVVPLFPVLFAFSAGIDGFMFVASPIFGAFILCIAGYTDVSYDGTAFASVLSSGIRGRADRWGRILGAASVGIPLTIVIAVVITLIAGQIAALPAVLGGALGLQLVGYGVTAVSSALITTPVAAPGDSPFKTVPGQTFVSGLLVFVVLGACGVLASPAVGLSIAAIIGGSTALGWVALAVGLGVGAAVIAGGVFLGGRTLEQTGSDLLLRIKAFPVT